MSPPHILKFTQITGQGYRVGGTRQETPFFPLDLETQWLREAKVQHLPAERKAMYYLFKVKQGAGWKPRNPAKETSAGEYLLSTLIPKVNT